MTDRVLIPVELSPAGFSMAMPPSCSAGATVHRLEGRTMGTAWSVALVAGETLDAAALARRIQVVLDRVVAQMSTWERDSDLSRFNRAAEGSWHALAHGFFTVLECALAVARDSGGAYDPTVGPLVNLWGFGPEPARASAPDEAEIAAARARCGWQRVALDDAARRVRQPGGAYVDLSAVAKGYGVDRVARELQELGVASYLVEVGGELRGFGVKPDGTPWWVEIEPPPGAAGGRTVVALHGLSVATSGDYRKFFDRDGRRYSHSIDPRTGWPVANRVASVTVLHPQCMWADAHATAMTVLGPEDGMDYARRHGLAALFVLHAEGGAEERLSPALAGMLE